MMYAMMAMQAAGGALSAYASIRQGQVAGDTAVLNSRLRARELAQQAQMVERQAQGADVVAVEERQATAFESARHREASGAYQSQQRAEVGASGLEATGSPLLVMSETAKQLELDRLALEHAGEQRARGAEEEARLMRYQAEQLRKGIPLTLDIGRYQSRAARQAGTLGAFSSILSSGSSMAASYYGGKS